jgi:hypothetical protein
VSHRQYAAIGPSFFSGDAAAYRGMAKKFGADNSDPDAGGYHLNQIHWHNGVGSSSTTDAYPGGWMSLTPTTDCDCETAGVPCDCG